MFDEINWWMVCGFLAAGVVFLAFVQTFWTSNEPKNEPLPEDERPIQVDEQDMTVEQLKKFDGKGGRAALVGINGSIYNVSATPGGRQFYGEGCAYNVFAGRDSTMGFAAVSTKPEEWPKSISELTGMQMSTLREWEERLASKYPRVGTLIDGFTIDEVKPKSS